MQPIKFPEANFEWGVPKGAEDSLQPLPCWVEKNHKGQVMTTLSCWELSEEEVQYIIENRKIWLKQANSGQALQPQLPIAGPMEFPKPFAFHSVYYQSQSTLNGAWIYVSENISIPELITIEGEMYAYSEKYKPRLEPQKALDIDDLYFRTGNPAECQNRYEYNLKELDRLPDEWPQSKEVIRERLYESCYTQPILCRKKQAGKEEILF